MKTINIIDGHDLDKVPMGQIRISKDEEKAFVNGTLQISPMYDSETKEILSFYVVPSTLTKKNAKRIHVAKEDNVIEKIKEKQKTWEKQ